MPKRTALTVAALTVWLALLFGCAAQPPHPMPEPTLYQRLGGLDAITAVVDTAIGNIAADARINQRFGNTEIPRLKKSLVELVCARTGGPCTYTGRNMADTHDGMNIRDAEFDALIDDFAKAFDKFKMPAREKSELLGALGQMRNSIVGH